MHGLEMWHFHVEVALRGTRDSGFIPSLEPKFWKENPSQEPTSVEGHTGWWTLVSPRSSHPLSSISRHLESGTRALGKNWHVPLSHRVRIFKNWQATRVFQIILYMSVENTIPWQKIWFTLYKEHGDMVELHNRLLQKDSEKELRLPGLPAPVWTELQACFQTLGLLIEQRSMTL